MSYHDHQLPILTTFGQFRPTALDVRGVGSDDDTCEWGVSPVSITRDSRTMSLANWAANLENIEAVDPDGEDHEVCRFGHWGPGWFEIVIVRPGSKAERVARENAAHLENHPVLDESKWTEMEMEAVTEWWDGLSLSEKIRECADKGYSIFAARHSHPPERVEDSVRGEL
jgi:hypothetical protein